MKMHSSCYTLLKLTLDSLLYIVLQVFHKIRENGYIFRLIFKLKSKQQQQKVLYNVQTILFQKYLHKTTGHLTPRRQFTNLNSSKSGPINQIAFIADNNLRPFFKDQFMLFDCIG